MAFRPYQGPQPLGAGVAELVDADAPQASGRKPCGFESRRRHGRASLVPGSGQNYFGSACGASCVATNRCAAESRGASCSPAFVISIRPPKILVSLGLVEFSWFSPPPATLATVALGNTAASPVFRRGQGRCRRGDGSLSG